MAELFHNRFHRSFPCRPPTLYSYGEADNGTDAEECNAEQPPMCRCAVGKRLYPPVKQVVCHWRCNHEAYDEDVQILLVEHRENALGCGTEHLAHAYLLALRLCLEEHKTEDSDEGNQQ